MSEADKYGGGLGWTSNPLVGAFAYLYTFTVPGFIWLSVALLLVAIGSTGLKAMYDAIVRGAVILLLAWYLMSFHLFSATLNIALE